MNKKTVMENATKTKSPTILLIGSGRLSKHLCHYLNLNNMIHKLPIKLFTWNRHQNTCLLYQYILQATHIWLAISDSAIIPFYESYLMNYTGQIVHFSGALHDNCLISAHPLMSFSEHIYSDNFYPSIYFALTGCQELSFALPGFSNPFFVLPAEHKAFYHALCVMAGNFPQMLWNEIEQLATLKNIPSKAFDLYIQKITENFLLMREKAITGPLVRKDRSTIHKNIEALSNTSLQPIYQSFIQEFLK